MYDLKRDPKEMVNIFDNPEYSDKKNELMQLLKKARTEYKDDEQTLSMR